MKKLMLTGTAVAALAAGPALAEDVQIGVIFGYTGPIESLTPQMADSAELAMAEINAAGGILGGSMLQSVRADSTCIDAAAATAAAERLITAEGVDAIVGADCSGVTDRHAAECRDSERHGDDLALGHLARADDDRG
jgi:branched-chain amino acid transport system substrate-binding protein